MLVRLVFASRVANIDAATMETMLADARQYNTENGITSILCHSENIFLQVLEGGRAAVNKAFQRTAHDIRHEDIQILLFEEITERAFCGWTLGHANLSRKNASLLLKYFEKAQFDPYSVSGKALLALLEELQTTASLIGKP